MIDEQTKKELIREVADKLAFAEGRTLVLAGVPFEEFPKGPNTLRTDGDVVAHAIVMALAGATNTGDIDDWFPNFDARGVKSIEYLPSMRKRLIEPRGLVIGQVDVTIVCGEQPRMKKRIPEMVKNIADGLGIDEERVHVKVTSMDGKDEIARLEGIEAHVLISLWEGL